MEEKIKIKPGDIEAAAIVVKINQDGKAHLVWIPMDDILDLMDIYAMTHGKIEVFSDPIENLTFDVKEI
jgi:hypothetical protein